MWTILHPASRFSFSVQSMTIKTNLFAVSNLLLLLVIAQTQFGSPVLAQEGGGAVAQDKLWCQYEGKSGPGVGLHIALLSGDEEYRSEETMPMLGQLLAKRYGFKCTVLFAVDPDSGEIDPDNQNNIPGIEMIDDADLIILGWRYRQLPDSDMKHFVDYVASGKPIIGYRTSTHAFDYDDDSTSPYKKYGNRSTEDWVGGFGQQILGDTWIAHHGHHAVESTMAIINDENKDHPVLLGVDKIWGPTDVYAITHLPDSATVLMKGQVLAGMSADDAPLEGAKNDPMMPVAWMMQQQSPQGGTRRVFCTTMGAATDFEDADLRRLIVNACFWGLNLESMIKADSSVDYVNEFKPTEFGFKKFKKGVKPADHQVDITK